MTALEHELLRTDLDPSAAITLQEKWRNTLARQELSGSSNTAQDPSQVSLVAGVDVAYPKGQNPTRGVASAVLWDLRRQEVLGSALASGDTPFPYIPGLLGFREGRLLVAALVQLSPVPELVFCDGHGQAHPRRCGEAVHVGVATGIPTVGVAKTPFYGEGDWKALPKTRGAKIGILAPVSPEMRSPELLGYAACLASGRRPVFISPGYRVDLTTAVEVATLATLSHRQPEPLILADRFAREILTREGGEKK